MRRIAAIVLVALGACMLVVAPLARWYGAPNLIRAPADQYSTTESIAEDATYFEIGALTLREGRTVRALRTIRGDVPAGDGDTAVWEVLLAIEDPDREGTPRERLVTSTVDRVAFDRRTSEAVNCCGEHFNGLPVEHEGIEYKFPFGAEQRSYQYFDTSLGRATEMTFEGTEELEGLEVQRYRQRIEPEEIARLAVPGSVVGRPDEGTLDLGRFYSNTRTVWVEPVSGVIVKGQEEQFSTVREDGSDEDLLAITDLTLVFTDATIAEQAGTAREARNNIRLITLIIPLVLVVLGIAGIGVGLMLLLVEPSGADGGRRSRNRPPPPRPEPAREGGLPVMGS